MRKFYKRMAWFMIGTGILGLGIAIEEHGFFQVALVIGIIVAAYKMGLWREDRYRDTTHSLREF